MIMNWMTIVKSVKLMSDDADEFDNISKVGESMHKSE